MSGARYAVGRVLIDAIQWTGSNSDEVKAWSGLDAPDGRCAFVLPGEMAGVNGFPRWWSPAASRWRVAHVNDWLVRATTDWGPIEGVYTDAYFREVFTPVPVVADQPPPVPNASTPIVDLVVGDFAERKRLGIERYGVALQADNGRDALVDLYQELLDACCYVRQAIEERGPARGDQVDAWLKAWRDRYAKVTPQWDALDDALDDYRAHGDTGTPLNSPVAGPHGDGL